MSMNDKTQLLEEYKMLRAELLYFMNKDMSLLTCLYSAVTATLFFSMQWKVPEGCLLAFLIIIPICNKFAYHQKQMAKISTYMIIFLEKELDIRWETRVKEMAKLKHTEEGKHNKIRGGSILKYTDSFMMALGADLCFFLILWQQSVNNEGFRPKCVLVIETIIIVSMLVVVCIMSGKIYQIQDYREKYLQKWQKFE